MKTDDNSKVHEKHANDESRGEDNPAPPPGPSEPTGSIHRPGAFAVAGINSGQDEFDIESELRLRDGDQEPEGSVMTPFSAEVVQPDEEDHRLHERVSQLLQEERKTAPFAHVVSTSGGSCWPKTGRKWLVAGAYLVSAAVLGIVLGILLPRDPVVSDEVKLVTLLSSASLDGGDALATPGTPQNMAYEWLLDDSGLETYTDQRRLQRYALATFYYSTNGDNWTNNDFWLDDGHECGRWWQSSDEGWPSPESAPETGFLNCTESGAVDKLLLSTNNLHGTIPEEIGLLSDSLEELQLYENMLTGPFPKSTGQLTNLRVLDVEINEMTGSIPTAIGELTKLDILYLTNNQFNGTIPTEVSQLRDMSVLHLEENDLIGSIPDEIMTLTNLRRLDLWGNELAGAIPANIGDLTFLWFLSLRDNALTGSLPEQITKLSSLREMYLQKNRLTGSIPAGTQSMSSLEAMHLYLNELTGTYECPYFIFECLISCNDPLNATCRVL